ncbi:MAG: hypothetical protein JO283_19145, partial [Bradyrhizobium sp.]|nr:hypothetical protein [Bradyrhizobium sp.]
MTVEPIGWVALFFGLVGLYFPPTFMVFVFLASTLLGAAAAIILPKLGGTTVQPGHLLLGFLFLKLMTSRDIRAGALRSISFGSPGFWLLITLVYSTITAFLMPRLFMGETMTYAARMQGESYA